MHCCECWRSAIGAVLFYAICTVSLVHHRRLHVFGLFDHGRRVGGIRGIAACLSADGHPPGRVCLAPARRGHAQLAHSRLPEA